MLIYAYNKVKKHQYTNYDTTSLNLHYMLKTVGPNRQKTKILMPTVKKNVSCYVKVKVTAQSPDIVRQTIILSKIFQNSKQTIFFL